MPGKGPLNPDLMFIGEAPGEEEDRLEEPFVGRVGQYLRKNLFRPLQIDEDEIFITNAVRCRPPGNKTPTRTEIRNCRSHLEEEIKRVKPKAIILLGNVPLCSVIFLDKVLGITKWRGKPMWSREFQCWVIATFHPSALRRDRGMGLSFRYDQAVSDFKKALEMAIWDIPSFKMPKLLRLTRVDYIIEYLKRASASGIVSVDSETESLDSRDEILGISMCYKSRSAYHPVYMEWKYFEENIEIADLFTALLTSRKITKIFQNVAFDRKYFHYHGYEVRGLIQDTMIMAHLLDENFSVGLKARTWIDLFFGGYDIPLEKYKVEHKFTIKTSYSEIPAETIAPYAAADALATYLLYEKYIPLLKVNGLWPLYSKISMPVRRVITEASISGIYVNMDAVNELDTKMEAAKKSLGKQIRMVAKKEFNFKSTQQLSKFLFEELKAPNRERTKTGLWKCDKSVLKILAQKSKTRRYTKVAQLVLKYKYIDKLQGTYIGQIQTYIWDDGRVHSSYNLTGTVTGRTGNSKPCLHNIPRDQLIRSLYAATPGNVLVEADVISAEIRTIAMESQDPVLLQVIAEGLDIHDQTYNEIFRKPAGYKPNQDERRVAKAINFGVIYGITPKGLAKRLGIAIDVAIKYIERYFIRFKKVADWIDKTIRFARKHGYVLSRFGRRRRLPNIRNDDKYMRLEAERQAMNSPISSGAADYTYIGLIRTAALLKRHRLKAKIVHTVHDCVLVDTPKSEVEKVKAILQKAFCTPVKAFPIQMNIDIEVTGAWGSHNESNLEEILKELNE